MAQTSNVKRQSQRQGVRHIIDVGVLAANGMNQYDRDGADLRAINRQFGSMNFFSIVNGSSVALAIDLDYTTLKRTIVPASSMITVDSVMFQELNLTNLSTTVATAAGDVYLTVGFERPLVREG